MYEILALSMKYVLIFIVYLFIFRITKLIYMDIRTIIVGEDSKTLGPHLKRFSSFADKNHGTVTEIYPIKQNHVTLGRSIECDIVLSDPHSSAVHAQIENRNNTYFIKDLKSANGTYVNGSSINEPIALKNDDQIVIGNIILMFSEGRR